MDKIIEIEIKNKDCLYEKYNSKLVSRELIYYLIDKTPNFKRDDTLKVIVNNKLKDKTDVVELIKDGLQKEYTMNLNTHSHNNIVQIIYLLLGIVGLFISSLINETILKEVVLIGGWVFIWALLEMEIFIDIKARNKRRIIQKLLNSEFEEK